MSRSLVFVLLAAVLAMAGYLFLYELPRERRAEEAAEDERRLMSFDPADADTLRIERDGRAIVVDRGEGDEWWVGEEPASARAVQNQLAVLAAAKSVRVLAEEIPLDQLDRYSLSVDPPLRITLEVVTRDGARHTLYVGGLTPGEDFVYVQRGANAALELGETNLYQIAWLRPESYRRTRLFDVERDDVVRLEMRGPRGSWTAVRDEQGLWWWEGQSRPTRLDRDHHNGVAYDLSTARIRAFAADGVSEEGFAAFGLKDPYGEIRFTLRSGEQHRLRMGNEGDDNTVFARRDDEDRALRILPQLPSRLEFDVADLVVNHPIVRNFARLDSVRVRAVEDDVEFTLRWIDETWQARMPAGWRGDPADLMLPMRNVLQGLEQLEVDDTMLLARGPDPSTVLDRIPMRVRMWWGTEPVDLLVGWRGRGEHHWVQIDSEPQLYRTTRDLYLALRSFLLTTGLIEP